MPDTAEVVALVLELLHFDPLGKPVDAADERVLDRLPHAAGERHELRRRQRLVAKKDDLVLEQSRAYLLAQKPPRKVDAGDLGPGRAGEASASHGLLALDFRFLDDRAVTGLFV